MTWPQYMRRECLVRIRLTRQETELLSVMLVRRPSPMSLAEMASIIGPAHDASPGLPEWRMRRLINRLRRKIGTAQIQAGPQGYRLAA